jgi:hypothetical protein
MGWVGKKAKKAKSAEAKKALADERAVSIKRMFCFFV